MAPRAGFQIDCMYVKRKDSNFAGHRNTPGDTPANREVQCCGGLAHAATASLTIDAATILSLLGLDFHLSFDLDGYVEG
jgi:hypothetical protein